MINFNEINKRYLLSISFIAVILTTTINSNAQMRQVYLDNVAGNQMYKSSFYNPSTGYVAFRDWIGYSLDSGHTFTKKFITNSNVNFNEDGSFRHTRLVEVRGIK